jgi:hypothetical protein
MTKLTTKFFGTELNRISSMEDVACAVKGFCQLATADEISSARKELKMLSTTNPMWYNIINDILWDIELPLGSHAWKNRFRLLNAEFK